MTPNYPLWICDKCGHEHGRMSEGHLATFHNGSGENGDLCGWCGSTESLTEPSDFGYPNHPAEEPNG